MLNNITVLLCFDQIYAALVCIREFFQKHFRKPPNFWAAEQYISLNVAQKGLKWVWNDTYCKKIYFELYCFFKNHCHSLLCNF